VIINNWIRTYTVQPSGTGYTQNDRGKVTAPALPAPIEIRATIMRFSEKDTNILPEGKDLIDLIKIYTATKLKTSSDLDSTNGDTITYKGKNYNILREEDWNDFSLFAGLEHYRYVAELIKTKQ
jgi:hypothetical protein